MADDAMQDVCVWVGMGMGVGELERLGGRWRAEVPLPTVPSGSCGRLRSSKENLHASGLFLHYGVGMEQESACRGMEGAERLPPRPLARRFRNHSFKATQLLNLGYFGVTVDGVPKALDVFA